MSGFWLRYYDPDVPPHIDYPCIPLYQILKETAARHPNRPGINFFGRRLTYQRIDRLSDAFAATLTKFGIKNGERVALLLPNSPQFILSYYGILKTGAIVVALNPLSNPRELAYQISHSESENLITIPLFLEKVASILEKTVLKRVIYSRLADFMPAPISWIQGFREWKLIQDNRSISQSVEWIDFQKLVREEAPSDFKPEQVDPNGPAVLIYSGGTTGTAKGVLLSHFNFVANAYQIAAWGQLNEDDRMLAVLPFFHGYGMSVNMNTAILVGGELIPVPRFSARQVAKGVQKYRPTFFTGVPTMFVALSNLPDIKRYDLSSLKGIFVGAAPLTRAIKEEFEGKTGGLMIEGYGLTEAVTAIMANPYHGKHKVGSIGIPFPDVEVKILALEGERRELPPGELGEIVLRSPTIMLEYYKQPEETRETLVGSWLYTGDIGYMDEEGYFYITDRKKDIIIVGGFNVFPREIDELIYQHPKVEEGITIGIPDAYKGERIKVYLKLKAGATATSEEMIAYFRENLTPYKVPSEVEFRTDLPKSMIGKILRRALREEEIRQQQ